MTISASSTVLASDLNSLFGGGSLPSGLTDKQPNIEYRLTCLDIGSASAAERSMIIRPSTYVYIEEVYVQGEISGGGTVDIDFTLEDLTDSRIYDPDQMYGAQGGSSPVKGTSFTLGPAQAQTSQDGTNNGVLIPGHEYKLSIDAGGTADFASVTLVGHSQRGRS